jgi:hypothetical protein
LSLMADSLCCNRGHAIILGQCEARAGIVAAPETTGYKSIPRGEYAQQTKQAVISS